MGVVGVADVDDHRCHAEQDDEKEHDDDKRLAALPVLTGRRTRSRAGRLGTLRGHAWYLLLAWPPAVLSPGCCDGYRRRGVSAYSPGE
jgi:hypothetical protein